MTKAPHSEFILTDARDEWWNRDFLDLMASRLRMTEIHSMLDVGSGLGHWGHLWVDRCASDAIFLGIDIESKWIEEASQRSVRLGFEKRFTYRHGMAYDLPVADASFDMVTCQTLLMHLAEPEVAIAEMKRALVPGGLLLVAEPNNMASLLMFDSVQRQLSLDRILRLLHFNLVCNRGRIHKGEGDYSIGARLPEILADQNLIDIQVHINDHASPIFAIGSSEVHCYKELQEKIDNIQNRRWLWDYDEAKRLYIAGGGSEIQFQEDYELFITDAEAFVDAVRRGIYSSTGGNLHFLISARRNLE